MPYSLSDWTTKDIPSLAGKVCVVTGSSSGIGYEVAFALAFVGANVVIATRNPSKAAAAIEKIKDFDPEALVTYIPLDLTSLESVQDFVQEFGEQFDKLDILVNNAGVFAIPERQLTADGFELQLGSNYLGHFALTARLLKYLASSLGISRVVNVSSRLARKGVMNFDDLMGEKKYKPYGAYAQSKLANLLFTFELQRQSDISGWGIMAIAAHPGWARTNLLKNGPGETSCCFRASLCCCASCLGQDAVHGSWPILYACVSDDAVGGGYYGPKSCFELKGRVGNAFIPPAALDEDVAKKLWDVSAKLTKTEWPINSFNMVGTDDFMGGDGMDIIEL